ncbi:MAG: spore coat U domain-containing protein, partial [Propionibacteriaceae bacterium]
HGRITRPVDGQGAVGVTCTPGVDYTIALGTGRGGSSDPTARVMLSGVNRLLYGLYSDVSRTQPWGSTVGAVVTDTGVAGRVSVPVYGRVQPQDVPSGSYADTVTVTITYQ